MLSSILLKRVISKNADTHPFYCSDNCINAKQLRTICSRCEAACSAGVFTAGGKPCFDTCTNCNLCLSVCPSQAILPSLLLLRQIFNLVEARRECLYISCHKGGCLGDLNLPCFASLPWEIYSALALNGHLVFSKTYCQQCENHVAVNSLFDTLQEIHGSTFFQEHYLISGSSEKVLEISRREIFKNAKNSGGDAIKYLFSDTNKHNAHEVGSLFYRKYLIRKWKASERKHGKYLFSMRIAGAAGYVRFTALQVL